MALGEPLLNLELMGDGENFTYELSVDIIFEGLGYNFSSLVCLDADYSTSVMHPIDKDLSVCSYEVIDLI